MKKKILIPCIAALATTSIIFYQVHKTNVIKDTLKKQVIEEINASVQTKKDSNVISNINNQIDLKRITSLDSSYAININQIYNEKLQKTKIADSKYLSYSFDAKVSFSKNNKIYNKIINSSVIVDNVNNVFVIKSIDDLEQDLLKCLIQIKKENSEDFSEELNTISLIYQNEELDIQINYPDYYTYNAFKTNNDDNTEYNVSFYMDNEKTSNYIQFVMLSNNVEKNINYIDELKKQGYELLENEITTQGGVTFSVLTQSFIQNFKDITEIMYVSHSGYKNIDNLIITAKLDSSIVKSKQSEVEEIIKSLK